MSIANHRERDVPAPGQDTRGVFRRRHTTERRDHRSRDLLEQRVLAEFREMPCLRLTAAQAQRLFGLRQDVSVRIIGQLVRDGLLRLDPDGRYAAVSIS